jgi:hypothetical protein
LATLAALAALILGGVVLANKGGDGPRKQDGEPSDHQSPVRIHLSAPTRDAMYDVGETVYADFSCTGGPERMSCKGTVPDGDKVETGTAGDYTFIVKALDQDRKILDSKRVRYTVVSEGDGQKRGSPTPTPTTPTPTTPTPTTPTPTTPTPTTPTPIY